jgi:hypothetical protein
MWYVERVSQSITRSRPKLSLAYYYLLRHRSPPRIRAFITAFPFTHSANNKIQPLNKILFTQQLTFVPKEKPSNDPFHRRSNSAKMALFISYDKVPLPQSKLRGESAARESAEKQNLGCRPRAVGIQRSTSVPHRQVRTISCLPVAIKKVVFSSSRAPQALDSFSFAFFHM